MKLRIFPSVLTLALAVVLLPACGSSSPVSGNILLSCNSASIYTCTDFGAGYSSTSAQAECNAGGKFSSVASCSTVNTTSLIGSCTVTSVGLVSTVRYFSAYSGGSTQAQAACTSLSGTWTSSSS
jgi:hypothetical protein